MAGSLKLSDFRANVQDFARPNRFWMTITGGTEASKWKDSPMSFLCKSASLPNRTIGEVSVKWQGMTASFAGDPTFDTITFTFRNDYNWEARNFWENWAQEIANMNTNERTTADVYTAQITLQQLGRSAGDVLATYVLEYAHPQTVEAISLDQESSDTAEEFTVTIKYDYYTKK